MKKVLDFIIKTMNGMAYGLFSTLIIGTIISTIGGFFSDGTFVNVFLTQIATFLKNIKSERRYIFDWQGGF